MLGCSLKQFLVDEGLEEQALSDDWFDVMYNIIDVECSFKHFYMCILIIFLDVGDYWLW